MLFQRSSTLLFVPDQIWKFLVGAIFIYDVGPVLIIFIFEGSCDKDLINFRFGSAVRYCLADHAFLSSFAVAQPAQNYRVSKRLTLGEKQRFCFRRLLSKHKITKYAKNLGGNARWPQWLRLCFFVIFQQVSILIPDNCIISVHLFHCFYEIRYFYFYHICCSCSYSLSPKRFIWTFCDIDFQEEVNVYELQKCSD